MCVFFCFRALINLVYIVYSIAQSERAERERERGCVLHASAINACCRLFISPWRAYGILFFYFFVDGIDTEVPVYS